MHGTTRTNKRADVLLSRRLILDGLQLGSLLRDARGILAATGGPIANSLLATADQLALVRERRGDASSRLGLLVNPQLFASPGVRLWKNGVPVSGPTLSPSQETHVPAYTVVSYGIGDTNRLAFQLPQGPENRKPWGLGPVVLLHFANPAWWKLPPQASTRQFLISTRQEDTPYDGYWVDVGDVAHAFYAKGRVESGGEAISIMDGHRGDQRYDKGTSDILLGNRLHGAIVGLGEFRQAVPYAGVLIAGLILAHVVLISLLLPKGGESPGTRTIAPLVLLGELTLLLLTIRAVVAFRVSLLPPSNTPPEVFDKSLRVSLLALALAPIVLLAPLAYNRFKQHGWFRRAIAQLGTVWRSAYNWFKKQDWYLTAIGRLRDVGQKYRAWRMPRDASGRLLVYSAVGLLGSVYVVVAKFAGQNQSFLGARVNHVILALMAVMLAIASQAWVESESATANWAFFIALVSPLVVNILVMRDRGTFVYLLPFLLAGVLRCLWKSDKLSLPAKSGLALVTLLITLFPLIGTWAGRAIFHANQIGPETETLYYRLVPWTQMQSEVLSQEADQIHVSNHLLRASVQQSWQMRLYAAEGADKPRGFGGAPLTNRGMSYPVVLTDAVFSSLILAEYGAFAGWALICAYVFMACVCLVAGWYLSSSHLHRALPLAAIGGLLGISGLYLASGNIGLAAYTGLNLPLLGLYSGSDCAWVASVLLAAGFLMIGGKATAQPGPWRSNVAWAGRSVIAWLLLWAVIVLGDLAVMRTKAGDRYRGDYKMDESVTADVRDHLKSSPDKNPCWSPDNSGKWLPNPGCSPLVLEKLAVDELNLRSNKTDPSGGFVYLSAGTNSLRVNENYFNVSTPFREPGLWRGTLEARTAESDATFMMLGKPLRLAIAPQGLTSTIYLDEPRPDRLGPSVLIAESRAHPNRICELERISNDEVRVASKHLRSWGVFVEGHNVNVAASPDRRCVDRAGSVISGCGRLAEGDIVVLEKRANDDQLQRRDYLVYLGVAPAALAYTKWVNGDERHVFPQREHSPFAYTITRALDRQASQAHFQSLSLTIDVRLQRMLQQAVNRFANGNPLYHPNDEVETPSLAVTALDPLV